jgi:hypothetical protein
MSSFGESRGQLISSPVSGDDRLLAVTAISCSAQHCAAIIAEAVVDWITLLAGMAASCI